MTVSVAGRSVLIVLFLSLLPAAGEEPSRRWLHVRVEETGRGESVKVNVPLDLVSTVAPLLKQAPWSRSGALPGLGSLAVRDLKPIWAALRAGRPHLLLQMDSPARKVRVFIENEHLYLRSEGESGRNIRGSVPVWLVDALLSGPGEGLNLSAAVKVLRSKSSQQIVFFQDPGSLIRVWVDETYRGE